MAQASMLKVKDLKVNYGGIEALKGISFNVDQGEARTRPLPKGLHHLRIYIDRSSVEIFVNDGDAVFTTRAFPTADEAHCAFDGDAAIHMWRLKDAVTDDFTV